MIRFQFGGVRQPLSAFVLSLVWTVGLALGGEQPAEQPSDQTAAGDEAAAEESSDSRRLLEFSKALQRLEERTKPAEESDDEQTDARRLPPLETAQRPGQLKPLDSAAKDVRGDEGGESSPLLGGLGSGDLLHRDVRLSAYSDFPDDDTSVSVDDGPLEPELVAPGFGQGGFDAGGYRSGGWGWTLLPEGLIYKSYLAGPKESRFASVRAREDDFGPIWDVTLGGRVGILRWGSCDACDLQGWQLDIEGAAFPRLDMNDGRRDLVSADFRFGVPLTHGEGPWKFKYAYYHLSSHLGDEFILRTGAMRINYVRDALVYGVSYDWWPDLRLYGEAAYAFHYDGGAQPWEFQFGVEWTPPCPTGIYGAPFIAANLHLREDFDFAGDVTMQAGWSWRGDAGRLIRVGFHYYNGKSPQYVFFDQDEEQAGIGIWYDY